MSNDPPSQPQSESISSAIPAEQASKLEADVTQPALADSTVAESPVVESPVVGSPVVEEPAMDSPAVEAEVAPVEPVASQVETVVAEETNTSGGATGKLAIGSQRDGVAVTEPKAVAQAKANPLATDEAEVPAAEVAQVRSTLGLDGADIDLNLDDAALGDLLAGSSAEKGSDELVVDQKYSAKVVRQNEENVFVLIKDRFDGIIPVRTFKKKPTDGDAIEVVVTRHNTEEGLYELRIPGGAIDVAAWDDLVVGALLEVKVTAANTGGLECIVNGIRGFVPGGQIDVVRVETFGDYVGKKLELQIIEVDKKKKKLILSRKAILEKDQKEAQQKFLETLEIGSYFDGTVTRLMDFGAFISISNGVEGMAHVSKLSWDRVKHPKDVLAVGQSVRVKVDKINKENGKISLSVKDTMTNPWYGIAERYPDGTVLKGTVTKLADFGAFVSLEAGIEGMVHISELAHGRVSTVQSAVKVGEEIDVKVLSIDTKKRRIALSRKATLAAPVDESRARHKPEVEETTRELAVKPGRDALQGGRGKSSGGEQFGLRW